MKRYSTTFALLKKSVWEGTSRLRKGNFDLMGLILKGILFLGLVAVFVVFGKKFADLYLTIPLNGVTDAQARLFELFSATFFALFLFFALLSASKLSREFFAREDLKLFSALPLRAGSVYAAGMITVYFSLLPVSALILLPLLLVLSPAIVGGYLLKCLAAVLLLPLLSLSFGALLSLPYHALMRFLGRRYLLALLFYTLLAAAGFYAYAKLLGGVKAILLGDDLKYFFNESRMLFLHTLAMRAYPGVFFARLVLQPPLSAFLWILGISLGVSLLSLSLVGVISRFMQTPEKAFSGGKRGAMRRKKSPLFSLLFKERKEILRSSSYSFSCFSTAAILPLMVYFCMSTGDSLVKRVVGIDCSAELALFLTLIFGSLCNVFCSTNISREGENFYTLKAIPVSAWEVFGAKILFCLFLSALSQAISAAVLCLTGYVSVPMSLFLFAMGTLFSLAQICFATKYDFRRAKFSADEDGEASESGGTASAVVLLGMLSSFAVGGIALLFKLLSVLRFQSGANLLYASGIAVILLSALCFWYLARRLKKEYADFSGGGLL